MDDEVFVERVLKTLSALPVGSPFFAAVQFNATHFPFLEKPPRGPEFDVTERVGRYDNAVRVLDDGLDALLSHLQSTGQLSNTVVLLTADHGENHGEHDAHRTQSFYEEVAGIPFFVFVPERHSTLSEQSIETLRSNAHVRVQNLDVVPTLLDVMGVPRTEPYARFRAAMPGQSLFEPVAADRVLVARNVVPIRRWSNEGFGLTRGSERYIFTEWQQEGLFDLSRDPQERNNLIVPGRLPEWVHVTLAQRPDLKELRDRLCRERPIQ